MRISDWSSDVCSSDLAPAVLYPHIQGDKSHEVRSQQECRGRPHVLEQLPGPRRRDYQSRSAACGRFADRSCVDRKRTRMNSSCSCESRMPPSACKKNLLMAIQQTITKQTHAKT